MKKTAIILLMGVSLSHAQGPNEPTIPANQSVQQRLNDLEALVNIQKNIIDETVGANTKERYTSSLTAIQSGLEVGSEIELIVPSSLRLLATKDLTETISAINNPTSESIGTPFSELVAQSAAEHLLPAFSTPLISQQAKTKFKDILKAIFTGPLVQGVLNSNPITSTINAAIQQAGLFEKNRQADISITKRQINQVSNDSPIKFAINTANTEGPSYNATNMDDFNNDLKERVAFYTEMNEYSMDQNNITQQLYMEAKIIKRSTKASKSEICRLLQIEPNDAIANLNTKYSVATGDEMKNRLKDVAFKKAISLSNFGQEQLPDVKEFNAKVIKSIVDYIDGYISLLNKYKGNAGAKLNSSKVDGQITRLQTIKTNIQTAS
jgi:hypothetical protein